MSTAARAHHRREIPSSTFSLTPAPAGSTAHEITDATTSLQALEQALAASDLGAARRHRAELARRLKVVLARGCALSLRVAALAAECRRLATTNANVVAFYSEQLDHGRAGRPRD
jgi:hypothetical protein